MEDARTLLEQERLRVQRRLAALTDDHDEVVAASLNANADDEHDPEGATIAFERSQVDSLITRARQHLGEVEAAVARLEAGTYGDCEVCGRPVGDERLEARPAARTCVDCARAAGR